MSKYIDKVMYINLDRRQDRKDEVENELDSVGLKYERFRAFDYPSFGAYGCGMSHLAILKKAKREGYRNILILEDDFKFLISKEQFEEQLSELFCKDTPFDVCMISYNVIHNAEIENSVFNRVVEAQTTSGYIVNSHYYDKLIDLYNWSMPILLETKNEPKYACDQIWKKLQTNDRWIHFKTRIGCQRPSFSDIGRFFANYWV